jgi:hypothetical protein
MKKYMGIYMFTQTVEAHSKEEAAKKLATKSKGGSEFLANLEPDSIEEMD